jgi:hypothetical protein
LNHQVGFLDATPESDASVQGDGFKLDVEAVAVGVCPRAADANPVVVAAFVVANIVGEVAGRLGLRKFVNFSNYSTPPPNQFFKA